MATKARAVQVPGEPAQEQAPATEGTQTLNEVTGADPALEAGADLPADDGVGEPTAADHVNEEVAILRAQLEAERLARLEAEQRAAQAEQQAEAAVAVTPVVAAPVTPGKAAHLSKAGWVVPASYGSPAKA